MALTSFHLHELAFIFGILGNIVSFGVYLAPLPTFWRIYKKKSTQGFQSIPYSVALFSAMILLYYAFIKETDGTMIITINTIGCAIEGLYLIVYLIYAPQKARIYTAKMLCIFNVTFYGLIVLTTMAFTRGTDHHRMFSRGGDREKVVGWICAVFSVSVFAAPLSVMRMVIRTKSVEFMPFWLSFSLTLCAVMWFFYGFLIHDFYIALPNILGFAFGITQMILYIIYKDTNNKNNNDVINGGIIKEGADIKQFQQELATVDMIKIGKIEQQINGPQGIEVVVEQVADNNNGDNNENGSGGGINGENNVKADEKVLTVGIPPRGDSSV